MKLPPVGRARALVIVAGNTRAMWPHVLASPYAAGPRPVDDHVAEVVHAAIERALAPLSLRPAHAVCFSPDPPPRRIAMQQLAHVAGLAALTPSHLCVHPIYGPWIALRAAIVIDVEGPPPAPPPPPPCDCTQGCGPALEHALAASAAASAPDATGVRERWRLWVAVRDACPIGRAHRYGENQLRYHYTGDRSALRPD